MSYARFGWDGSDVYVYLSVYGYLDCCGCALDKQGTACYSTDEMIAHLEEHKAAGHHVPQETIDDLLADKEENDATIKEMNP